MTVATLGIITRDGRLLLGEKKKGEIGVGIFSGPGGKVEMGETLSACLIRETREEVAAELDPLSLELVARMLFHQGRTRSVFFNRVLEWLSVRSSRPDFEVYVYQAHILSGEPRETDEMIPAWYSFDALPFDRMYEADRHWLPRVLRGEKFCANVYYFGRARVFNRIEPYPFTL